MLNKVKGLLVKSRLRRLSESLERATIVLEKATGSTEIAREHLKLAQERHNEAIVALKYNNPGQSLTLVNQGLMHVRMIHAVVASEPDSKGSGKDDEMRTEAEDVVAYLSTCVARMKSAIEYSNCEVSDFARSQMDAGLQFYDLAMDALEEDDSTRCRRCAQAGLIALALARDLIDSDNGGIMPAWSGLENPMVGSPVRRIQELLSSIVQLSGLSSKAEEELSSEVSQHIKKAVREFNELLRSISDDNIDHAQALVTSALSECNLARLAMGAEESEAAGTADRLAVRGRQADIESFIADAKTILDRAKSPQVEVLQRRLDAVLVHYEKALKASDSGVRASAERQISAALFELDFIRDMLKPRQARTSLWWEGTV